MQKILIVGHYVADSVNQMLSQGWRVEEIVPTANSVFILLTDEEKEQDDD